MMLASAIFLASIGLFVIIPTMQLSTLAISATVREGGRGTAQSDTTVVASAVVAARPVLDTQSSLIDGLQADFRPTEDMEDRGEHMLEIWLGIWTFVRSIEALGGVHWD